MTTDRRTTPPNSEPAGTRRRRPPGSPAASDAEMAARLRLAVPAPVAPAAPAGGRGRDVVAGVGARHRRAPGDAHARRARRVRAGAAAEHDQDRRGSRGGGARGPPRGRQRRPHRAGACSPPRAARPRIAAGRCATPISCAACVALSDDERAQLDDARRACSNIWWSSHDRGCASVAGTTFRSLHMRNYRLYFTGQIISVSGTWMQSVALAWLVVALPRAPEPTRRRPRDHPGPAVPAHAALRGVGRARRRPGRQAPPVVLRRRYRAPGAWRWLLGLLVLIGTGPAGSAHLWEVYLLSLLLGVVNMFDNPARQTFVIEMVGKSDLPNAVSLNSIVMNGARVIGPAIGGVLIATVGLGVCFLANAASYVAVDRGAGAHAPLRAAPSRACGAWQGPAARGAALRVAHPEPARPAHPGVRGRAARLQLHRDPAPAGPGDLPRRRRDLRHA